MTHMTEVICGNKNCKKPFKARTADVNRGWGRFCSKSCKATYQSQTRGRCGRGNSSEYCALGHPITAQDYADEYGGTPVFDQRGNYEGFMPTPFDNSADPYE